MSENEIETTKVAGKPISPAELALRNELGAMRRINNVLEPLTPEVRRRVLAWAFDTLNQQDRARENAEFAARKVDTFDQRPIVATSGANLLQRGY